MIARRVEAIVLAPADSKALVTVARKAVDAGIVVVNIDNRLDADAMAERELSVPFVGPDNRKGARAVGALVASRLHAGDPVAILEGAPNAFNGIERTLGFEDAAREAGLHRRALANRRLGNGPRQPGRLGADHRAARRQSHPVRERQHGARRRRRAASAGPNRAALVAGFDNISAVQALVKSGEIVATADQHGDQLAVFGIEYALERIRNPGAAIADRETPVDLVTAETLH